MAWDGKKVFDIIVLLAAAVVMTAAVFDVIPSTETPAAERNATADADGPTGAKPKEHRRDVEAAVAPRVEARIQVKQANDGEKDATVR